MCVGACVYVHVRFCKTVCGVCTEEHLKALYRTKSKFPDWESAPCVSSIPFKYSCANSVIPREHIFLQASPRQLKLPISRY